MSEGQMRQTEEMKLREAEFKKKEEELKNKAATWVKEKMAERMLEVGADEKEVRKQVEHEADRWVKWNMEQFKEGKPGTESPEQGLGELHGAEIPQEPKW